MWPHRWQPARLPRPWDSPGKNTGVDCHFLLQCMKVKKWSRLVVSNPQRPHGLQPSRLFRLWDFPGRSTGVGCYCLLQWKLYWYHSCFLILEFLVDNVHCSQFEKASRWVLTKVGSCVICCIHRFNQSWVPSYHSIYYWENPHISGFMPFKLPVFKDQLYILSL